jgi:SAM-dependent methyltransferase
MSDSGYTDESGTGTEDGTSTGAETPAGESAADGEDGEKKPKSPEEEEDAKEPEPEPEPEPDPLEGLTYDDDPELPLPPYGDAEYWEKRYTDDPDVFEWYQDPDAVLPTIKKFVDGEGRLLVIGTGNSDLAPFLHENGFESVTAIDFVKPCIVKSRKRNAEIEGIVWKIMDVRKMNFPDGDFQAVIDKGTLDSIFFAGETEVLNAMTEISRVLKKRGVYICVSCAPPDARKAFFNRPADLKLELETTIELKKPLPSDEPHYVYVVRKGGKLLT